MTAAMITVEFCGEEYRLAPGAELTIGRDADLVVDDNPYLHRVFLAVGEDGGLWWLRNVGTRLAATVASPHDGLQAWLPPGARLPLVFGETVVVFTAGPTTYEIAIRAGRPTFTGSVPTPQGDGSDSTIGDLPLTRSQRALIVALAEPLLRREGGRTSEIPSSADAAARLGWSITKFNRKLDNVCEKFDRIGVAGLRGEGGAAATARRARLVEYALAARVVTAADLPVIEAERAEARRTATGAGGD